MNKQRKILLASDFIQHSHITLDAAIDVAKELKAELVLVHVIHDSTNLQFKTDMQKLLNDWSLDAERKGATVCKTVLKEGEICDAVIACAKEEECAMILIGYGKHENVSNGRIGSFAKKIIKKSDRPVLLIKKHQSPLFRNILCSIDILETSRMALEWGIKLSKECQSELVVLHAVQNSDTEALDESPSDLNIFVAQLNAEKNLDQFLAKSDFNGSKWRKVILNSMNPRQITDYAELNRSSIIIVGDSNSNKLEQFLFGSLPEKIMNLTDLPILLIK